MNDKTIGGEGQIDRAECLYAKHRDRASRYASEIRFPYDETTGTMQTIYTCGVCGEEHKSRHGFELAYELQGETFRTMKSLCPKCEKIYRDRLRAFAPEYWR